jgi:carboxyl-terminal processing protease
MIRRLVPLVLAASIGVAAGQVSGAVLAAEPRAEGPYAALDLFARVLTQIGESYVEPVSQRDLVYHALAGMDDALDAHSLFLPPDAFRRMREESDGQFVGIGATMHDDPRGLRITGVLRDGPAAHAGLLAGDTILSVDETPLAGMELEAALSLVRGREGEAVTLGIERDGAPRSVPVLRTRLLEASVEGDLLAPGWAYLRVRQFRDGVAADLASHVAALSATTPIRGAVLDLRSNPGGRLDQAVATVDLFLHDGRIVSTRGRSAHLDETYDATPARTDWDWPLVVLVDGQSASAAEIVAGALQDRKRARLFGERSYGKGSVQSVFEYEDGSALKLTIARYYLPSGRPIEDRHGLVPDVVVGPPTTPGATAELRARLENQPGLPDADRASLLELVDRIPQVPVVQPIDFTQPAGARLAQDPALAAAFEALKKGG